MFHVCENKPLRSYKYNIILLTRRRILHDVCENETLRYL